MTTVAPENAERHVKLQDELDALQLKIDKLDNFFDTDTFENDVSEAEQVRLRMQSKVMQIYAEILEERISALEEDDGQE